MKSPRFTSSSDKGFLPLTSGQYIELLDWTARHVLPGKGAAPSAAPAVLVRLGITGGNWSQLVNNFSRLFYLVAGRPHDTEPTKKAA